jgi:hypothetical protein
MKKLTLITGLIIALNIILTGSAYAGQDSVSMGPFYENDVYYSFETGEVASVSRTNWDIGFYTSVWSAAVITNGASGVELYLYPDSGIDGWESMDTTGLSGWPVLYNSPYDWENGAFNRNSTGHPDYGWGTYNPVNHDVTGDSLYILKLQDGSFKKMWIMQKNSINNIYQFKFSNLDNSGEVMVEFNANEYSTKNFVYYSLAEEKIVDREPASDTWDVVFTKYMSIQPNGTPYPVTGVLNNMNVAANRFENVSLGYDDWTAMPMDTAKSPIGYEWKDFDLQSFSWAVTDSLVFFVQTLSSDVYKLVFNSFEGSMTGKVGFETMMISATGVNDEIFTGMELKAGPVPASDYINIFLPGDAIDDCTLSLVDINGRTLLTRDVSVAGTKTIRLGIESIPDGAYILQLNNGKEISTRRIIVSR